MSQTERTEESSSKNTNGDPPKMNIDLPEISELTQNYKRWKDVELPIDILLLTVKDCEFLSCYHYIVDPFRSYYKGLGHVYFGSIGEDQDVKLKVALMRCSEGSKALGGSLTVVKNAVTQLRPKAVFSVGHCSGMNQETTKLGDVVLSEKLTTYSYQKATKDRLEFCGVTTPVSRDVAELIKYAGYGWNAPLENPKERKVEVHCGEVLSGPELVQAEWRSHELVKSFPGAIAIETEGEGVYSAAHDLKMEWVVIKGISGYPDGTEAEENWKTFASVMAASVVISIVNDCSIFEDWPHYKDISTDGQDLTLSKRVPVETSCSNAQYFQNASSAKTAGGKRKSSSESVDQGIERSRCEGGSTEHLVRTSLKRRNEEPSLCEAPACKERKTASQGLRFKAGEPSKDELEALSRKLGNKWEKLARRLGFDSDGEIDAFKEEKGLANKAFSMLKEWNQKEGSNGTYVVLGKALCHKFVGCTILAEEFCCDKIEGNGSH